MDETAFIRFCKDLQEFKRNIEKRIAEEIFKELLDKQFILNVTDTRVNFRAQYYKFICDLKKKFLN